MVNLYLGVPKSTVNSPHPLLHYCQYVPLDCASGSISGAKPSKTLHRLSIIREGEGAGQWCWAHLSTIAAKLRCLFSFHLLFYYMAEVPSSTFNPHRLLQIQSLSPTSSLVAYNFGPRCQLHPSLPTSTLVAFQFPTPDTFLFPPLLLDARGVLDAAAARWTCHPNHHPLHQGWAYLPFSEPLQ
jgi:hypothetical protein